MLLFSLTLFSCSKEGPYGIRKGDRYTYTNGNNSTNFIIIDVGDEYIRYEITESGEQLTMTKNRLDEVLPYLKKN
jgi:hypothetical protein